MDKIKLNLFDLKSKKDLLKVREFFSKSILRWFNQDNTPKEKYFELRACPLCESEKSNEAFIVENFSYHKCSNCNSLYTKPHLRDGVLDALYDDGTYQVYQDKAGLFCKTPVFSFFLYRPRKFDCIKTPVLMHLRPALGVSRSSSFEENV